MDSLPNLDVPSDIVRRITIAADQLHEENGRSAFPNVDAVRRKARVNMNDASAVMRAWRRNQTAAAAPLPSAIPDAVQAASQSLLTAVWAAATSSANANLQTAQAGWEQERTEAEACRQQLASAFDSQTEELAQALQNIDAMTQELATQGKELQAATANLDSLRQEAAIAEGRSATAEARIREIVKRTDDLKTELGHAHTNAEQERIDTRQRLETADATVLSLREELRQKSTLENDLREELARMRGQVDAMASEQLALLETLKPNIKARASTKSAVKPKSPNGA